MYQNDTILTLKTPRWRPLVDGEPGDWQTDGYEEFKADTEALIEGDPLVGEEFPYNRVRVVGPSPIVNSDRASEWVGSSGQQVIIQPVAGFDSNVDYPLGFIQSKYDIAEEPIVVDPRETVYGLPREYVKVDLAKTGQPTPEEVFAAEAPPEKREDAEAALRAAVDPLGASDEAAATATKVAGPLGDL